MYIRPLATNSWALSLTWFSIQDLLLPKRLSDILVLRPILLLLSLPLLFPLRRTSPCYHLYQPGLCSEQSHTRGAPSSVVKSPKTIQRHYRHPTGHAPLNTFRRPSQVVGRLATLVVDTDTYSHVTRTTLDRHSKQVISSGHRSTLGHTSSLAATPNPCTSHL